MRVDLYASRPHYASHLLPVFRALPRHLRGFVYGPDPSEWWVRDRPPTAPNPTTYTMIAGYCDLQARDGQGPFIYVEHGAGQTYPGDPTTISDASYSGGAGHRDVALYIAPSETVADRWRHRYGVPSIAAGCPVLDPWHRGDRPFEQRPRPTVALTWHWDCHLIPETRSAFRHYETVLGPCVAAWRAQGFDVVGHAHPRVAGFLAGVYAEHAVPTVTLGWIYDHADVLVCDNSSVMYEFASLGRDVVCLNAPWYRRDIEHGLRFWEYPPGLSINSGDVLRAVVSALLERDHGALAGSALMRDAAVHAAYTHIDGYASWRAAAAVSAVEDRLSAAVA